MSVYKLKREGFIIQSSSLFDIPDLQDEMRNARACYLNVCSNDGGYKIPIKTTLSHRLKYFNMAMVHSMFNFDVDSSEHTIRLCSKRLGTLPSVDRALVIAPRHIMNNAMFSNFSCGVDLDSYRVQAVPTGIIPISDPDYTRDVLNATIISTRSKAVDGSNVFPAHDLSYRKLKPSYSASGLYYHGRNLDYSFDRNRVEAWIDVMVDLVKATTDECDTIISTTGDLAVLGIACMETNRRLVGIEQDAKQFELDSMIMDKYLGK